MPEHQHQVQADEQEHQRRDEEDMKGEEAAQSGAADAVASEDEARDLAAHDRHAPRLRRAHDDGPDRGLIPPEQLTGERQCEGQQQEDGAGEPVELAGELVRRHQVGARHVDADEQHHGRRAEVVHAAQEPAEQRLFRDELQAVVRLAARRHVGSGERDAGGDLEDEGEESRAAEDVPPPGPRRHRMR
jgi:hypothetical protein